MQLRAALASNKERTKPLNVVCCIANPETARVLAEVVGSESSRQSDGPLMLLDVIEYRTILGGMLTQVRPAGG